jgi:hypothetical protein
MRRTPLKRRYKRQIDRQAAEAWANRARTKPCARCGGRRVQGHHVIAKQTLRQNAMQNGYEYERVVWDARNLISLCERCHGAHHAATHRLSLSFVRGACPRIDQFAREVGLEWWLERTYPEREAAA